MFIQNHIRHAQDQTELHVYTNNYKPTAFAPFETTPTGLKLDLDLAGDSGRFG